MSELSFEQMLEESLKTIRTGEVVTGKVIDVKEDEIVLNIGYKSDGIITRSEYTNESNVDLRNLVHVGDEMEAKVVKVNDGEGQVALSYKRLAADRGNKRLEEAFENHEVLTAKVSQVLDGGLSVIVDEARILSRQALYPTYMRKIYPNMLIKRSNSLSQSSIREEEESSATASSLSLLRRLRCRKLSSRRSM